MCLHFSDSVCVPTKGPKAGQQCIFPFTQGGKTCPGPKCCNLSNSPEGPWCSTKVDANGNHVGGNYAFCEGSPCDPGIHYTLFYRQLGCLAFSLRFRPKMKQLPSLRFDFFFKSSLLGNREQRKNQVYKQEWLSGEKLNQKSQDCCFMSLFYVFI